MTTPNDQYLEAEKRRAYRQGYNDAIEAVACRAEPYNTRIAAIIREMKKNLEEGTPQAPAKTP